MHNVHVLLSALVLLLTCKFLRLWFGGGTVYLFHNDGALSYAAKCCKEFKFVPFDVTILSDRDTEVNVEWICKRGIQYFISCVQIFEFP